MTDLETLRRALRAGDEPAPFPDGPDVASIMVRGRRLRVRRRVTAASGVLCLAGLVLAVVTGIAHFTRPSFPAPQRPQAPSYSRPAPVATPTPHATRAPRPKPISAHSLTPVSVVPSPVASHAVPSAHPSTHLIPAGPTPTVTSRHATPAPSVSRPPAATPVGSVKLTGKLPLLSGPSR
jgi:hypothetical protein